MTNCVAIGVDDKYEAAEHYCRVLGFERGNEDEGWVEVKSGVSCGYFPVQTRARRQPKTYRVTDPRVAPECLLTK